MWRRSTRGKCSPEPDQVRTAREIAEEAERVRDQVEANEPKVKRLSSVLRDAVKGNHFGETLEAALARRGTG